MNRLINLIKGYYFPLVAFLFWRFFLEIGSLIGNKFWFFQESFPYINSVLQLSQLPQTIWQWANFDGVHYLEIIRRGYGSYGIHVFFPVFPLAVRLVKLVIVNDLLAGLIISHFAILIAGALLYRLVKKIWDKSTAKWAIVFMYFFPTSFFFAGFYTESLFLLLALAALSSKGILTAIFSALTSGTRLAGVFLAATIFSGSKRNWWRVGAVLGVAGYMIYLWIVYGDPLLLVTDQRYFANGRASSFISLVTPPQVLWRYAKILTTISVAKLFFWIALLELGSFILGCLALISLTFNKKIPRDFLLFAWPALILPVLSGTLSSMPRYLITIFPIFIFLALIKSPIIKSIILLLFAILLIILTSLFVRGYFVA